MRRIRVLHPSVLEGPEMVFQPKPSGCSSSSTRDGSQRKFYSKATAKQSQQTSKFIVSYLCDHELRVVRTFIGSPSHRIANLNAQYESKTVAICIAKVLELVSVCY